MWTVRVRSVYVWNKFHIWNAQSMRFIHLFTMVDGCGGVFTVQDRCSTRGCTHDAWVCGGGVWSVGCALGTAAAPEDGVASHSNGACAAASEFSITTLDGILHFTACTD